MEGRRIELDRRPEGVGDALLREPAVLDVDVEVVKEPVAVDEGRPVGDLAAREDIAVRVRLDVDPVDVRGEVHGRENVGVRERQVDAIVGVGNDQRIKQGVEARREVHPRFAGRPAVGDEDVADGDGDAVGRAVDVEPVPGGEVAGGAVDLQVAELVIDVIERPRDRDAVGPVVVSTLDQRVADPGPGEDRRRGRREGQGGGDFVGAGREGDEPGAVDRRLETRRHVHHAPVVTRGDGRGERHKGPPIPHLEGRRGIEAPRLSCRRRGDIGAVRRRVEPGRRGEDVGRDGWDREGIVEDEVLRLRRAEGEARGGEDLGVAAGGRVVGVGAVAPRRDRVAEG